MGGQRTRPTDSEWDSAMDRLLEQHDLHGEMPWHVLVAVGAWLNVASRSVSTRYGCFLRRLELDRGTVVLTAADHDVIRESVTLGAAHRALVESGRLVPFPMFERAVWREAGDRDLVDLRKAEVGRRAHAAGAARCALCSTVFEGRVAA